MARQGTRKIFRGRCTILSNGLCGRCNGSGSDKLSFPRLCQNRDAQCHKARRACVGTFRKIAEILQKTRILSSIAPPTVWQNECTTPGRYEKHTHSHPFASSEHQLDIASLLRDECFPAGMRGALRAATKVHLATIVSAASGGAAVGAGCRCDGSRAGNAGSHGHCGNEIMATGVADPW